jgi:succinate dehydrogenase hydrophobic anchor subunit
VLSHITVLVLVILHTRHATATARTPLRDFRRTKEVVSEHQTAMRMLLKLKILSRHQAEAVRTLLNGTHLTEGLPQQHCPTPPNPVPHPLNK